MYPVVTTDSNFSPLAVIAAHDSAGTSEIEPTWTKDQLNKWACRNNNNSNNNSKLNSSAV